MHPADAYAVSLSGPEHPLIERCRLDATARYPAAAHMCSGPTQGKLLATLCRLRGASKVLELGTFCGYGTLWLSSASKEVITVDRDERAANIAKEHFRDVPADWGSVRQVVADRGQYLDTCTDGPFDLVYVDCDKKGYAAVFDVLLDTPGLLSANACLVFDNTLWKGRVAEGTTGMSPSEEEAILAEAELRWRRSEAGAQGRAARPGRGAGAPRVQRQAPQGRARGPAVLPLRRRARPSTMCLAGPIRRSSGAGSVFRNPVGSKSPVVRPGDRRPRSRCAPAGASRRDARQPPEGTQSASWPARSSSRQAHPKKLNA